MLTGLQHYLSHLFGWLAHIPLPKPLSTWTVKLFAWKYAIDCTAASREVCDYRSVGEFFVRDLKPNLRPIAEGLVSPIDGTLRSVASIQNGELQPIKDKNYSASTLIRHNETATHFEKGWAFNFYLSPTDYHHVHAPVSGRIIRRIYVPGALWPVNSWSVKNIDGLFSANERVTTCIECEFGLVALIMVGAFNVGRIILQYDPAFASTSRKRVEIKDYPAPIPINRGERIGTFKLGSAVLLLVPPNIYTGPLLHEPRQVLYGTPLFNN